MSLFRKRLRPILLTLLGVVIIAEIVALSPSVLEEELPSSKAVPPEALIQDREPSLAPGVPKDRIAEYAMEKFQYLSIQKSIKQWKIDASVAFLYNPERLVHARNVKTYLYDGEDRVTVISGLEAKYFLNQRDLEIFGDVHTLFPDGFELKSQYLRYLPNEKRIIIPTKYFVEGSSTPQSASLPLSELKGLHSASDEAHSSFNQTAPRAEKPFTFTSQGLNYDMNNGIINLNESARVLFDEKDSPNRTLIVSDHCLIFRNKSLAQFTMSPDRPLESRFIHLTQPTLIAKGRTADLNYGDYKDVLRYLSLYDDVLIKETGGDDTLRYSTSGHADFDSDRNIIVLTQLPQVYQDSDTVTGDQVLIHRDSGVMEVDNSNSFSVGSKPGS